MQTRFFILIFSCLLFTCCKEENQKKNTYSTIKTYLQKGDEKPRLFRTEKFDTIGNAIELITYHDELIGSVSRATFDSSNLPVIIKKVFPGSKNSRCELIFNTYNSKRLLTKRVTVLNSTNDSIFDFYEYDSKNRLKTRKTITQTESFWSGILEYHYNEHDSLCLVYMYDLNMENRQVQDSIVYYTDLKNTYTKSIDGFDFKNTYYKNGLKTKEFENHRETNYFYDSRQRIIKKEVIHYHPGGMLDASSPPTKDIYTYEYE